MRPVTTAGGEPALVPFDEGFDVVADHNRGQLNKVSANPNAGNFTDSIGADGPEKTYLITWPDWSAV